MKKGLEARLVSRENKQFISLERENKRKTEPYQEYYKLDEEATVCLILQDNQAIACGAFRVRDEEQAELIRLYVKPEFRNKGHARQILDTLELHAMFQGCTHMLAALEKNEKATRNLYQSLAYQQTKAWKPFVGDKKILCVSKELV